MNTIPSHRDRAVDLARALCILGVVVLHSLMVGVTVSSSGPVFSNAGDTGTWIVPVSWMLQVMPLFFVIGGFSGLTALRAQRRQGSGAAGFVAARVRRLLVPAVASVATAGAVLALLADAGLDGDLVGTAGYRYGQPLWFLGVFLLCQGLLPAMARLHERAPLRTILVLAAAALAVDIVRVAGGAEVIGYLNLVFVWSALQQLGFVLADGRIDALPARVRVVAAAVALGVLLVSFVSGFHSPDLIANTNPPTTALLLVGVIQTAVFSLLRSRICAAASRRPVAALTRFVTARAMTVYLWHMPVLLGLAGVMALIGMSTRTALPELAGAEWWLTRPLWLACTLGVTALVAIPLSRLEVAAQAAPTGGGMRAGAAVLLGAAPVAVLLVAGTSPVTAALAVVAWMLALRLTAPAPGHRPAAPTTGLPQTLVTRSTVRDAVRIPG